MQIITRWNHINERRLSSQLVFGVIFSQGEGGVECLRAVEDIPSGVEITISYRLNILDSSLVDENHYHSFWRIVQIANEGLRWRRTFQLGLSAERFWRRCSFYSSWRKLIILSWWVVSATMKMQISNYIIKGFGFKCNCPVCSLPTKEAEIDDNVRREVRSWG